MKICRLDGIEMKRASMEGTKDVYKQVPMYSRLLFAV